MLIGLTGGPGAGKTLAARFFEEYGAIIISGDDAGKVVLAKYPSIIKKLRSIFGEGIFNNEGILDRRKLGRIVFGDPKKMSKFNHLVHPYLLGILRREISEYGGRKPGRIVVVDAALIYEWGIEDWFDQVIVVTATRAKRIGRMMRSGLTRREAEQRIGSQIPQRKKASMADYVLENNASKSALGKKVRRFLQDSGI